VHDHVRHPSGRLSDDRRRDYGANQPATSDIAQRDLCAVDHGADQWDVDAGDPRRSGSGYGKCDGSEPEAGSTLHDADPDGYADSDSDRDTDRHSDGYTERYGDAKRHRYANAYSDGDTSTNGDTDPDPGHLARHDHGGGHHHVHRQHATHLHG
jgi:hypothetical protein